MRKTFKERLTEVVVSNSPYKGTKSQSHQIGGRNEEASRQYFKKLQTRSTTKTLQC